MLEDVKSTDLFCEYYAKWIEVYKEGAIRKVTMDKYRMTLSWLVSMTTTQKTYLHIIQELENKDVDLVMRSLSGLS